MLHDAKPALLAFGERGWALHGIATDTALAAYLARPDQRSYDLTDLALRYLQRELRVEAPDDGQLFAWEEILARSGVALDRRRRTLCSDRFLGTLGMTPYSLA